MHAFKYHRPSSVNDAAALAKGEAKLLAGGQSLVQAMKLRLSSPSDIIDLGTIKDLAGIKSDGKAVTIGAMARHADVAHSAEVKKAIPALAALAGMIGDRQVRAMGTLGGSIANNDPAADYPAAVLALNATITTNKGKHEADKFFKGLYETPQAGRDHHFGELPGTQARRVHEVQKPGLALRHRRGVRSRFRRYCSCRSDGRRPRGVPPGRHGESARRQVRARVRRQHQAEAGRPQHRPARQRRIPRAHRHRHGQARRGGRAEIEESEEVEGQPAVLGGLFLSSAYCVFCDILCRMRYNLHLDFTQARRNKGLTQEALAKASDVARVTIARFEAGAKQDFRLGTLERLCESLGLRLAVAPHGAGVRGERAIARAQERVKRLDARRRHAALAAALLALPAGEAAAIVERARANVERWGRERLCSDHYISRWRSRLEGPVRSIALRLLEHGEWTDALLQNTPWSFALEQPAA